MTCTTCGHDQFSNTLVNDTFHIGERIYLIEAIPAEVCERCGDANFSAEVGEQVRLLVHGPHKPERIISTEVLAFKAA